MQSSVDVTESMEVEDVDITSMGRAKDAQPTDTATAVEAVRAAVNDVYSCCGDVAAARGLDVSEEDVHKSARCDVQWVQTAMVDNVKPSRRRRFSVHHIEQMGVEADKAAAAR